LGRRRAGRTRRLHRLPLRRSRQAPADDRGVRQVHRARPRLTQAGKRGDRSRLGRRRPARRILGARPQALGRGRRSAAGGRSGGRRDALRRFPAPAGGRRDRRRAASAAPEDGAGPQRFAVRSSRRFSRQASSSWPRAFGFSAPKLMAVIWPECTPSVARYFFAESARRWPRARLYWPEPRSSQFPSIRTFSSECAESTLATLLSFSCASLVSVAASNSKTTLPRRT